MPFGGVHDMTVLVQNIRKYAQVSPLFVWNGIHTRITITAILVLSVFITPSSWSNVFESLSDAYLAVAVFVAGTLTLVYSLERAFKTDIGVLFQKYQRWQVLAAALLGAFPGCGGAIIAITQYTRGYLSFGGVVATLTATMGDAMFLLMASEPKTALGILALSIVAGSVSGYIVDAIHGPGFMRSKNRSAVNNNQQTPHSTLPLTGRLSPMEKLWIALIIPGLIFGLLAAFQVDVDEWLSQWIDATPVFVLGITGALLAMTLWVYNGGETTNTTCDSTNGDNKKTSIAHNVIHTTNFVTAWVVFAFVGYEVVIAATGFDLANAFTVWSPLIPLVAVLIGFVPGCGPQILVTSFYLSGAIPLSAQLANAMANDGDALFPAIATAPKAAMMATIYSAVPALLIGYGWHIIFE